MCYGTEVNEKVSKKESEAWKQYFVRECAVATQIKFHQ